MIIITKFKVIDCGDYVYISSEDRWQSGLSCYLFDGQSADRTNKAEWYKLSRIPSEILMRQKDKRVNERFELKAGYSPTELMPSIITMDMYHSEEYDEVIGLYNRKYDTEKGGFEPIEFEISVIYSRKDFEFIPNKYDAKVDLLTQIEYPEEAYQDRPCQLSSEQMFTIIRNHVKRNIDPRCAKVAADYDFHFEVTRSIGLSDPYTKLVDANNSWANKKRKPKWVTHTIATKEATILNIKSKPSDSDYGKDCCLAPVITGENYEDLTRKVDQYLDELMASINKKYCECTNCKGWGVVEVEDEN